MAFRLGTGIVNVGRKVADSFRRDGALAPRRILRSPLLHAAAAGFTAYEAVSSERLVNIASTLSRLDVDTAGIYLAAALVVTAVTLPVYAVSRGIRSIFNYRELRRAQTELVETKRLGSEAETRANNLQSFRDQAEPLLRQLSPPEREALEIRAGLRAAPAAPAAPAPAAPAAPAAAKPTRAPSRRKAAAPAAAAVAAKPAAPAASAALPAMPPLPITPRNPVLAVGSADQGAATTAMDRDTVLDDLSPALQEDASGAVPVAAAAVPRISTPGGTEVLDTRVQEAFGRLSTILGNDQAALRGLGKVREIFSSEDADRVILGLDQKEEALINALQALPNLPPEIDALILALL